MRWFFGIIFPARRWSWTRFTACRTPRRSYGFDTGFAAFAKGWEKPDNDSLGMLFEHWVLNEFNSILQAAVLNYWRDKAGHEVDFVWKRRGKPPVAIECKWHSDAFDVSSLRSFRHRHPEGENLLVSAEKKGVSVFKAGGLAVTHLGVGSLRDWIAKANKTQAPSA